MFNSHKCKHCNRTLVDADSVAIGYGPVCYRKIFGKKQPTEKVKVTRYRSRRINDPTIYENIEEVFKDV